MKDRTKSHQPTKLISHGIVLEDHEFMTISFLIDFLEHTIELVPPSNTPGRKTSDLIMNGVFWEMKSPIKSDTRSLERLLYRAGAQSPNVIIDLRRLKEHNNRIITALEKCFRDTRRIRRMMIITKTNELKNYQK